MEESLFDSVESAARCINGDLKKTVFRQFLKLANSGILSHEDATIFSCSAVFVATSYQGSVEDERRTLSKQITELLMMPQLVEELVSFWKEGTTCSQVHTMGICSLLHLLINSWQYTSCSFKKCLQEDGLLAKIVVSLKVYFNDVDKCSLEKDYLDYKLLCYCLETIYLRIDNQSSRVKCVQLGLLELIKKLAKNADTTIQLISKAIIALISECTNEVDDIISLTDEEITLLLELFQTESNVPLCISDCTIASMLKGFMSNKVNVERFEQQKLTCLLEQKWHSSNIDLIITQLNNSHLMSLYHHMIQKMVLSWNMGLLV